jgi:uncharacterized membrane protein
MLGAFVPRCVSELVMDKLLVAIFDNETKASRGARVLQELHAQAKVLVYALAVITKRGDKIAVLEIAAGQARLEPVIGRATRSLIKLLEEPLSSIDDAGSGPVLDRMINMVNAGVEDDFVDEVLRHLLPGTWAMVSEIEEETATDTDTWLEALGGIIFRCVRRDVMDDQIARDLDVLLREVKRLEHELLQAREDSKARVRVQLDLAKNRFQTTRERARYLAASIKGEAEAKIVSLQERAARADPWIKARFETLANEVRVDYVNRATKLNLAWQSAGEVFAG